MKNTFPITSSKSPATPIQLVTESGYKSWLGKQTATHKKWLTTNRFEVRPGSHAIIPDSKGGMAMVLAITEEEPGIWSIAHLPEALPPHTYQLAGKYKKDHATQLALGWALGCYEYTRYKSSASTHAKLKTPAGCDLPYVKAMTEGINWARDLVNAPPNDMHTSALAKEATNWAKKAGATVSVIKGKDLLKQNYPLVYHVGQASSHPPHLVELRFAKKGAPKITLVGKGVCFDSGGLDLKSSKGMRLMKKDMGGAAAVLALAQAIIATKLPVQLRVLLPIVENSVAGNAIRPSDVVKSRKGLTVEIGNTDAEGRLILCDALTRADEEKPDLIIDCATLTGAARVALGTDVPAFFTPDNALAKHIATAAIQQNDPIWQLPLHTPYRAMMDSAIADISNDSASGYGGAITAALYLQEFVTNTPAWVHVDMMAWNLTSRPGRPQGGEAMAVRALYEVIKKHYGK